jgi:hypothetical protein
MLKNAIELKEHIDNIPGTSESIGKCVSRELDYYKEHRGDGIQHPGYTSDEVSASEEWAKTSVRVVGPSETKTRRLHSRAKVDDVIQRLRKNYKYNDVANDKVANWTVFDGDDAKGPFTLDITMPIGDDACTTVHMDFTSTAADAEPDLLQRLYAAGAPSPFGNVKEQVTVIDETVRKAREFAADAFRVSPSVCRAVEQLWCAHLTPNRGIRAVPYKINVYGEGDKFDAHTDTPAPGLVGTFLLGIGDTSTGGGLRVHGHERRVYEWESTELGTWCAFYSDLVHRVDTVEGGFRANVAFKIYVDEAAVTSGSFVFTPAVIERITQLMALETGAFGIILSHDYSLNATQLKGFDRVVYDLFQLLGFRQTAIIPVVVGEMGTHDDDSIEYTSEVYAVDEAQMEPWMRVDETDTDTKMPFYEANTGYCWTHHSQAGAEHTGNESQPAEIESIYLSRALILKK